MGRNITITALIIAMSVSAAAAPQKQASAKVDIVLERLSKEYRADYLEALSPAFDGNPGAVVSYELATAKHKIANETYEFTPVLLVKVAPKLYALLSTGSLDNAGHSSEGINAIHYLADREGGYKYVDSWFDKGATGTVGNGATAWASTKMLGSNTMFLTEEGGVWQGCGISSTTATELGAKGPVDVASFISHSSSGAGRGQAKYSYTGKITSAVKDKSFTVTYSGTSRFSQTYVRKGAKYERVGPDRVRKC